MVWKFELKKNFFKDFFLHCNNFFTIKNTEVIILNKHKLVIKYFKLF